MLKHPGPIAFRRATYRRSFNLESKFTGLDGAKPKPDQQDLTFKSHIFGINTAVYTSYCILIGIQNIDLCSFINIQ